MVRVKRLTLDVLKPHQPNGLEFSIAIAEQTQDCSVMFSVSEVDEKTETVVITIEGVDIDFQQVSQAITTLGGSIHSIDEVHVENLSDN